MTTDEMDKQEPLDAPEVDIQDSDDDTPLEIPVNRRRVKTEKLDLPVDSIYLRVKRGKLNLQPEFQRNFVWNHIKASRLIESLLLDIPIPVIYVAEEAENAQSVVDGQQRLKSICSFIDGKFPDGQDFYLSGLQVLTELNGKLFKNLTDDYQDAINNAILRVIVIQKDSDPDVKFEVFERLNLGAEKLNDMELRNCVYRGKYNNLLRELVKNHNMLKIMRQTAPHNRMKDRQLILRFFAMWRNTHLRYKPPFKQFMNREIEKFRDASDQELASMTAVFEKSIDMAYTVFGEDAFRRFYPGQEERKSGYWEKNVLNVSLWDTILYTFSFYDKSQIVPISDAIREEYLDIITNNPKFIEYVASTGDKPDRVQYRADEWKRRLDSLVANTEPRNFSRALKEQLFNNDPTCQICGQRIQDIDGSEVDHVEHYWRGGKTIPENARLAHRFCNRQRGGRD